MTSKQPSRRTGGDHGGAHADARPGVSPEIGQKERDGAAAGAPRSDAEVRGALDALLRASKTFDGMGLELLVTEGVVVMLGVVPNYQVKHELERQIARVRGVREIHDQLQVSSSGGAGDGASLRG